MILDELGTFLPNLFMHIGANEMSAPESNTTSISRGPSRLAARTKFVPSALAGFLSTGFLLGG